MTNSLSVCMALAALCAFASSCSNEEDRTAERETASSVVSDKRYQFRLEVRQHYNNRRFAKLEEVAEAVRAGRDKFADGSWKLAHFYEALECRDDEPESMWKLHESIHGEWDAKFPESITSRVAHADFLKSYAWHARGFNFADKVTEEGWRLFRERLEQARKMLADCKLLQPSDPRWGTVRLVVALGQAVPKEEYLVLYEQARAAEPTYFYHDIELVHYLMPRWHGEPGDWEAAAEEAITRPGGLGHETYARVVQSQMGYYDNVFEKTAVSWRKARMGIEEILVRYPGSAVNLNMFCRMSCFAGDKKMARDLFEEIGGDYESSCWRSRKEFDSAKSWAKAG